MKSFKAPEVLISAIVAAVSALAYVYTTFATISYVDKRHEEVKEVLLDIKDSVRSIDIRLWQMKSAEKTTKRGDEWKQ